jgi:hypothetical protein
MLDTLPMQKSLTWENSDDSQTILKDKIPANTPELLLYKYIS